MAAIVESVSVSQDALPACLCPWLENPYRLVSLWDMLQFGAVPLVELGRLFEEWMNGPALLAAPQQLVDDNNYAKFKQDLQSIQSHCDFLNLEVTQCLLKDVFGFVEADYRKPTRQAIALKMGELHRALTAELNSRLFFFVPPHRARFVRLGYAPGTGLQEPPFFHGAEQKRLEPVIAAFPSGAYDVRESGNCFMAGRNTACVFHLMRVLEIGLGVLGKEFGLSFSHTNWAPAIEEVERHIRDMHKDPKWKALPDYKEKQEFYAQAASYLGIVKDAWRNYTAHARGRYEEDEAESIYRNVGSFMLKLSTRLRE